MLLPVLGLLFWACGTSSSGGAAGGDDAGQGTGGNPVVAPDGGSGGGEGPVDDAGAAAPIDDASVGATGDGGCGAVGPEPDSSVGCDGATLYAIPSDPGAPGPWAVGAHTSVIPIPSRDGGLTTEIWYPAKWGSQACAPQVTYDVREHLPPSDQGKIPDAAAPLQYCDCYRDLPIDDAHGPYPVIMFIHGTAAFRTQSLTFMTHWASRGFVVVSSDHPGIELSDILALKLTGSDEEGDAVGVLDVLDNPTGDLAFLAGHIDMTRIGASGHSAGGEAVSTIAGEKTGIQVVIPMAGAGVTVADGGTPVSSVVMSAADDGIAAPSMQVSGYASTPAPKRFVQLADAGHLSFSDLCAIGASQGGLLAIAEKYGVTGAGLIAPLASDGCSWQTGKSYTPITPQEGWAIVNYATSAAWEETLQCNPAMSAELANIAKAVPNVASYQQQL
jgi:predicted dienelactone hydrolase